MRVVCLDREQLRLSVPALQMSILSAFKARSWHCTELQPCEVTAAGRAVSSVRVSVPAWVITLTTLFLLCGTAGSVPPPAPGQRPGVAVGRGLCLAPFLTAALEGLHPSAFMQSFWNLGASVLLCVGEKQNRNWKYLTSIMQPHHWNLFWRGGFELSAQEWDSLSSLKHQTTFIPKLQRVSSVFWFSPLVLHSQCWAALLWSEITSCSNVAAVQALCSPSQLIPSMDVASHSDLWGPAVLAGNPGRLVLLWCSDCARPTA